MTNDELTQQWRQQVAQRLGGLAQPARDFGLLLLKINPDGDLIVPPDAPLEDGFSWHQHRGWDLARDLGRLSAPDRAAAFQALFEDLAPAFEIAFQRRGEIPELGDYAVQHSRRRAPGRPDLADDNFIGWLDVAAAGVALEPKDPVALAERSFDRGALIGCAADLPGDAGDRVWAALRRHAEAITPDRHAFGLVAALRATARPEAWQLLADLRAQKRIQFNDEEMYKGQLGALKVLLENYPPDLAPAGASKQQREYFAQAAARAALELRMFDPAARSQAYAEGTPQEIAAALVMQATIDRTGVSSLAQKLIASADPVRRAYGIYAVTELDLPESRVPAALLSDPDPRVVALAACAGRQLDLGGDADAALAALAAAVGRLERRVKVCLPGLQYSYPGVFYPNWLGGEVRDAVEAALKAHNIPAGRFKAKPLAPRKLGKWGKTIQKIADDRGLQCEFNKPAAADALADLESTLAVTLPPDLRELLLETNGVQLDGMDIIPAVDDIVGTTQTVRDACEEYSDPRPTVPGIIFLVDYGNGDYAGLCTAAVGKLKPNDACRFDHETGKLEKLKGGLKGLFQE